MWGAECLEGRQVHSQGGGAMRSRRQAWRGESERPIDTPLRNWLSLNMLSLHAPYP